MFFTKNTIMSINNSKLNQNSYNLFPLLISGLIFFLKKPFMKNNPIKFPKSIGEYEFESKITKINLWNSYLLGIYRNPKGGKAIFKMKDARIKDYSYYSLRNEIVLYEILNEVISRLSLPKRFNDIYIPKKIDVVDDKNVLGILIEYVVGSTARKLSAHRKIQAYFKIVDFLNFLGDHITNDEKKRISKRGPLHYILIYPFLVIKAIFTYPRSAVYILSGIPLFLSAFFYMLQDRKITLIHRDIHFENILISNKKLILIDLEQCVLTDPLYEVVTTLRYCWKNNDDFYLLLLNRIFQKYSYRKNFGLLFRGLIVNSATHGLTGNFPKEMIDSWINFLKYGVAHKKSVI